MGGRNRKETVGEGEEEEMVGQKAHVIRRVKKKGRNIEQSGTVSSLVHHFHY